MLGSVSHAKRSQATADFHAPLGTKRSLQNNATLPSVQTLGYIVFTAIADKLNCTEIAARLVQFEGLVSVTVDAKGTIETGQVSVTLFFAILIEIRRHIILNPTQPIQWPIVLYSISSLLLSNCFPV